MSPVLAVDDLTVTFATDDGPVPAVRGLSLHVDPGEVLALVGESGSGKSATAMAVVGLLPDDASVGGSVRFRGEEILGLPDRAMSAIRGAGIGTVFQDPMSALTPVFTVGDQIAEALLIPRRSARPGPMIPRRSARPGPMIPRRPGPINPLRPDHGRRGEDRLSRRAARARAVELLDLVGIDRPDRRAGAFPHQLSGGERQRVVIAIAVARDPDLLICDEPTTALDVTVQAQILEVLRTAQQLTGAAVLIITHDLGVVAEIADRAVVMYAGRPVETAPTAELFARPRMPYTAGLLGSVPRLDAARGTRLIPIAGAPPVPGRTGPGCPFHPRCPLAVEACLAAEPAPHPVGADHTAACIRTDEVAGRSAAELFEVVTAPTRSDGEHAPPPVLAVRNLRRTYRVSRGVVLRRHVEDVPAVAGVSFDLPRGRTLGIVGESGSGKSTTVSQIMELRRPQGGSIEVLGHDVAGLDAATRRSLRGQLQVVFQDPAASLDPRLPISDVLAEPLRAAGHPPADIGPRVAELLDRVGLRAADAQRYPSEFSGGQQQRIGIARALALRPTILALDEPVSALDVSIQAGIVNLLLDLQDSDGLSYLFVSHDLSVVRHLAHHVAVMRHGVIVEQGDADDVFTAPQHAYTRALLAAVPRIGRR